MPQPNTNFESAGKAFTKLVETVHRLRAPGGCPWDRAQTHQSLRQYLIEEAYEVLEVLDRIDSPEALRSEKIREPFREELGDLLMQVVLHAEMVAETGTFSIEDVVRGLDEKLIRRHPHVFGDAKADSADSAIQNWEKEKAKEKAKKDAGASVLDGLPKGLPSLQRAGRALEKVTKVGFQWKDMHGPIAKVQEEVDELKAEVLEYERLRQSEGDIEDQLAAVREKVESELGDTLFTLCNLAFLMKISPEDSLRSTLGRFERRFRHVEKRVKETGKALEATTLEEMDRYWDEAKSIERGQVKQENQKQ